MSEQRGKSSSALHPDLSPDRKQRLFERGIALFNEGRYFEAHEPWEEIWRSTDPEPRNLHQGLVQVAAALHIWHQRGNAAAARRVLERGRSRLVAEVGCDPKTDADWQRTLDQLEQWANWLEAPTDEAPPPPRLGVGCSRASPVSTQRQLSP